MSTQTAPEEGVRNQDVTRLAKGGGINLLGSASKSLFAAILLLVLGRTLGAAGAGVFLEATGVFSIIAAAAGLGVETGFIRSLSGGRATGMDRRMLRRLLVVGLVPVVVVGATASVALFHYSTPIADLIGNGQHTEEIATYLRILAPFVTVAAVVQAVLGATRGFETMTPTVVVDRFGKLGVQTALVAAAVLTGARVEVVALSWALPILGAFVVGSLWLARLWHASLVVESDLGSGSGEARDAIPTGSTAAMVRMAREFWAFTLPRSVASIFNVVVQWLDVLLVGGMVSPRAAGIYAASTRLISLGIAVARAMGEVSQPMIGRLLAAGRQDATRRLYGTATAWQMVMTWPQYIFVSAFAATVLSLFGPEFTTGWSVVVILALSGMVGSGSGPVDMVLLMAGKSMWSLWNTGLALGVNVGLNLLLIPTMGIRGAAVAWASSRVVGNVVPLIQTSTSLGLHPFGRPWARAATLSTACFGVPSVAMLLLVDEPGIPVIAVLGAVTTLVYVAVLNHHRRDLDLDVVFGAIKRRLARSSRAAATPQGLGNEDSRPMLPATPDSRGAMP